MEIPSCLTASLPISALPHTVHMPVATSDVSKLYPRS